MHEVVAPAIQLERGCRRAFGKFEKARVEGVIIGNLLQRFRAERPGHFLLERFGKQPIDVVVAVVGEHEPAVLYVPFELVAFGLGKLDQLMPAEVAKRTFVQIGTIQPHDALFLIDRNRGVFHQRMEQVDGHPLIGIPVSGGVLNTGEDEGFQRRDVAMEWVRWVLRTGTDKFSLILTDLGHTGGQTYPNDPFIGSARMLRR